MYSAFPFKFLAVVRCIVLGSTVSNELSSSPPPSSLTETGQLEIVVDFGMIRSGFAVVVEGVEEGGKPRGHAGRKVVAVRAAANVALAAAAVAAFLS